MDQKKLWEVACAIALVITMSVYMFTDSRAGLTNWWGVVFSPLCSACVCEEEAESEGYIFKWKTLEIMGKWFRFQ
ncbi:MAG: hypothetical protein IKU12_01290 [Oscillospiraceae bacterium]|nr:hypothetical protein [Oscillospiraceae bacterium]